MKEFLEQLEKWAEEGTRYAIATVVRTWGSSPRPVGSVMIISENGQILGSVSGGCVEGEVIKAAKDIMQSGESTLLEFGISNDEAWQVGLTCGGSVSVYVQPSYEAQPDTSTEEVWNALTTCLKTNSPCAVVSKISGGRHSHTLVRGDSESIGSTLSQPVMQQAQELMKEHKSALIEHEQDTYFSHLFPPKPLLLIIGAAHITVDLVDLAETFGFESVVIDPRGIFTSGTQFKTAPSRLIQAYPEEVLQEFKLNDYAYAAVLSHDPKIDDNALHVLLRSDIAYIGALGSRRTHARRVERLTQAGFSPQEIARIQSPIGISIGAKTPREIALSVVAQLIAASSEFVV